MHIPFIYILFIAEAMLVFMVLSAVLGIATYRLSNKKVTHITTTDDKPAINLGSSYIEHLETEIMKNQNQVLVATAGEHDGDTQQDPAIAAEEKHSKLLKMRDLFLNAERNAAEHAENDIHFWQHIYDGMNNVFDHFKSVEHETIVVHEEKVEHKKEIEEKVFYIETQGKKIDGEVNRLKDIIFEQENTLSGMIKALKKAGEEHPETEFSETITRLTSQVETFERQLRDAITCMEVLELENFRLLEEAHKYESRETTASEQNTASDATVDIQSMRKMIEEQEQQIRELSETIDGLKLSAEQTEKIKSTLNNFVHSSQEMMTCITILEEENERLLTQSGSSADEKTLTTQIKKLEEELIKKDVEFAKLQEEFSSMEKEYLAMYNAIHGDKG